MLDVILDWIGLEYVIAPEVPSAPIKSQLSHAHPALGVVQLPSFNLTTLESGAIP